MNYAGEKRNLANREEKKNLLLRLKKKKRGESATKEEKN